MRKRLLEVFYYFAKAHSAALIRLVILLTVLSACALPFLRISTSHSDLLPPDHPEQARFRAFTEEFGLANDVIVVLEGEPAEIRACAADFADELASETDVVKDVFYRADMELLLRRAPLFLTTNQLAMALDRLVEVAPAIKHMQQADTLPRLVESLAELIRNPDGAGQLAPGSAPATLRLTTAFFNTWRARVEGRQPDALAATDWLAAAPEAAAALRSGGYLLSHDGTLLFLFVQPASGSDDITYLRPLFAALRSACERVFVAQPELRGRVHVAFTGMPAHVLTEVETIRADVGRSAAVAILLVLGILYAGFRSIRKLVMAIIPLTCGMIITLGLIVVTVGRLNLISSSFLAVLFGIGIDFGIYLIRRTEEELGNGKTQEEAVHEAVVRSGKGVLTGGLTTSFAFFAVAWSDFVGFSELGISAGIGVAVVMLTTFLLLPALLMRVKIEPRCYDLAAVIGEDRRHHAHKLLGILVAAGLFCAFGIFAATQLTFDFNALHLLPRSTESTVYQLRMQEESDFQMTFAAVTADSLDELRRIEERAVELSTVRRIDSLSRLIPREQRAKARLVASRATELPGPWPPLKPHETAVPAYIAALNDLYEAMEEAQDVAFGAGLKGVVTAVDANLAAIEQLSDALRAAGDDAAASGSARFEADVFGALSRAFEVIATYRSREIMPITEDDLPPDFVRRFRSPKGRYVAYVYPAGSIWDLDFLDVFVDELHSITPDVTGFPVTTRINARMAVDGLLHALVYAMGMILVLLAIDFRRPAPVLLALVPLGVGMLTLQGLLYAAGRDYNYASVAGLPLLLGLGVVYGVHIVHRWQEAPHLTAFSAAATSGRGVAFAALTTMTGLCSIVPARHKGVSTFGLVILLGILCCLAAALWVLPALIDLFYMPRQTGESDEN